MRNLWIVSILVGLCFSCSETEEGLIGEWEGKTDIVGSSGEPVESKITCTISSAAGNKRNVKLSFAGKGYAFTGIENIDILKYKDEPLGEDSTVMSYISGSAELLNDTLLHFEHEVYTLKNGALTGVEDFEFNLVRK